VFITVFIIAIVVAVMFHEFGHYATAKAFGMKVERFFFGFGPTLWSFRRGETEYGVKLVPAGGFVKITGMSSFEEVDEGARGRTFISKPAWQRAIVLAAGSATHFVAAAALIFLGLVAFGLPTGEPTTAVGFVVPDTPAEAAGLAEGDRLVAVDGETVRDWDHAVALIGARPGETIGVTVERDARTVELSVALAPTDPDGVERGFLGIAPGERIERYGIGRAAAATVAGDISVPRLTVLTAQGVADAFSPEGLRAWFGQIGQPGPRDPEGPMSVVGAGQFAGALAAEGQLFLVVLVFAQINIVLGLLNMAPLPPLDGGHLAVLVVEESVNGVRKARGRPGTWRVDPAVLTPIALTVILAVVVLSVFAIWLDVTKPASGMLQ
jgi:membrane-associated protease RseP (regulator of RpoE activity)